MPAFSTADRLAIRAQPVGVIEADIGHQRGVGIDDVDGVEPAAEPDLQHLHVDPCLAEQPQRG